MDIDITPADKASLFPVAQQVVGLGTIGINIGKLARDVFRLCSTERHWNGDIENDVTRHAKYIGIGLIRLIPLVGSLYSAAVMRYGISKHIDIVIAAKYDEIDTANKMKTELEQKMKGKTIEIWNRSDLYHQKNMRTKAKCVVCLFTDNESGRMDFRNDRGFATFGPHVQESERWSEDTTVVVMLRNRANSEERILESKNGDSSYIREYMEVDKLEDNAIDTVDGTHFFTSFDAPNDANDQSSFSSGIRKIERLARHSFKEA
jgi:hypothetical protein